MAMFLLLLVVGEVCGSLDLQQVQDTSVLTNRMDKLERLLLEQDARLSDQERKLNYQEKLLRQQDFELTQQKNINRQQDFELTQQKNINRQQDLALSNQQRMLRHQSAQLSSQGSLLRQQGEQLTSQDNLLRQQNSRLSRQDRVLFRQDSLIQRLRSATRDSHTTVQTTEEQFSLDNLNIATDVLYPKMSDKNETVASVSELSARSDDGGPLEAVVSHISQQVTEMSADIQTLKNSNIQRDNDIQDAQSSTFVHWGSSQCSSSSQLVYSGVVGGSYFSHSGAATNYLCLTLSPVLADHQGYGAYLYGGEYQHPAAQHDSDPVCSVCRSTFSTTVMIPGTNVCTPGWHLQYSGFLMAGYYGHAAGTEYICVDSRFGTVIHSNDDDNGKLLYMTVTRCGSLPCPPYVNDKIVTCAVCSK